MSYTIDQLHILRAMAVSEQVKKRIRAKITVPENLMPDALAKAAGINQADLARFLEVSQPMLSNIQAGMTERPAKYIAALKRAGLWVD